MKRIVFATVLACAAMGASADVTVYGRVDTGLLWDNTEGSDTVTMESGIAGASRWGFKGSEKISENLTVGFQLESQFASDNGFSNATLFNRDSYLYVNTQYGNFRFGRSGALGGGVSGGMFAGKVSPFGVVYKGAASTMIHDVQTRLDNMVRYDLPKFGGLQLAVQYARGDDSVPESQTVRYAAVGADYKVGDLSLIAVVDKEMKKSNTNGVKDMVSYKVGLQYKANPVTFYAGYQYIDNADQVGKAESVDATGKVGTIKLVNGEANSLTLGTRVAVGGGNLNMALGYASGEDAIKEVTLTQAAIGYTYNLSKRTTLYAAAAYLDHELTEGDVETSRKTKQVMAGLYHAF